MAQKHSRKPSGPTKSSLRSNTVLIDIIQGLKRLEKNIPGMFYLQVAKPDGAQSLQYVTYGCHSLFGVAPEDALRNPAAVFELIHPEDRDRRDLAIRRMVETLEPGRELLRHIVAGEIRWYDCMAVPEPQPNGDTFLYGFLLEVTARKKAEEALGASERKLALAFETIPHGFAIATLDEGRYLEVNPGECRLTGYRREELIGRTVAELNFYVNPLDRQRFTQKLLDEKTVQDFQFQFRRKNGEQRWGLLTASIAEVDGAACVIGELADHTQQWVAEQELRLSEERLRLAVEGADQGLFDLDIPSGVASYSPQYVSMLGYDWSTFKKSISSWVKLMHPEDRKSTLHTYREYVKGAIPEYSVEFRMRTKSGDWKWILSKGKIVSWDPDGKPLRMLGTHTDITQQKESANALQQQKDLLAQKAAQLESANQALVAALQNREAEKRAIEESVFLNLKKLILPNVLALSSSKLPPKAAAHLKIIQNNLQTSIDASPFSAAIRYRDLTPKETQVAEFIRQGLATKDIAEFLGITPGSVSFHRNSIRRKLLLRNQKRNLRKFLSEMP